MCIRDRCFILLEQIIEKNIDKLFLNDEVLCAYPYRIMRNADLTIDEDEAEDLLKEIQKQLKMRDVYKRQNNTCNGCKQCNDCETFFQPFLNF